MSESKLNYSKMTKIEKLKYVDELIIDYPKMKNIHDTMEECIVSPLYSDIPECMSILGPSRAGKTTILKKFMERYPDSESSDGQIKQILYCEVPCPPSLSSLPTSLLYSLGDPFYSKGRNIAQRTLRLEKLLVDCGTKMIILDEVQHLIEGTTARQQRQASDWFKNIINKTRIPVVFSGLDSTSLIFEINSQLRSRVLNNFRVAAFRINDKNFRGILHVMDQSLPLDEVSDLATTTLWKEIYDATEGHLGYLKVLLKESVKIAIDTGSTHLTRTILAKAYQKKLARIVNNNPFL